MKRLFAITLLAASILGMSLPAHAVNVSFADGATANAIFGSVAGISFMNDKTAIASALANNVSTKFDLHLLGKSADFTNTLGRYASGKFQAFQYNMFGFDKNGVYTGKSQLREDVLLSDVVVNITGQGVNYNLDINKMTKYYSGRYHDVFDTNYYAAPPARKGNNIDPKFQLYVVTDDMVELNGNIFYKGSLIFALDDGAYGHTDFNDLIFVLGAKNPPVVPIPGAVFLLAPGLVGLGVLRKKMK